VKVDFDDLFLNTEVRDTGIGMTAEDLSQLFQFFGKIAKSSDINRGGMGLGLTISKMILQQLGGEIGVESESGKGSCFYFRIPID
jgi:signal transduction histidine kinase